jgi:stalled ribosome rescue protein Dom34
LALAGAVEMQALQLTVKQEEMAAYMAEEVEEAEQSKRLSEILVQEESVAQA